MTSSDASLEAPIPLARIIPRDAHSVSRAQISPNALRVLYRLKEAGYQGFLVGGCVRDLLLGIEPKDFDVATDALPEEVRRLFRNCRLVGRRFRLAHVFFGREIIEVATFRAAAAPSQGEEVPESSDEESDDNSDDADTEDIAQAPEANSDNDDENIDRLVDAEGRILRDNVYGTVDDDVWRRDFTVNALYYNIADFSIWDYVDGAADIAARRLRLIGDPPTRYREDPVRMLRGARFMAKLNFQLDSATAEPIPELRHLLTDVPPARLFDETLKLFLTGHGVASLKTLQQLELLEVLMPSVASILARAPQGPIATLLRAGLKSTDERALAGRPVSPTFLFAILLYGPIAAAIERAPPQRWHEVGTIVDACDRVTRELTRRIALPKRFSLGVREMFVLQPRLEAPRGRRALRLLEQPRFRAAYDLLLLRAAAGMANTSAAEWWTRLQAAPPQEQLTMCDALGRSVASAGEASSAPLRPRSRRRRGGRSRKSRPDSERS